MRAWVCLLLFPASLAGAPAPPLTSSKVTSELRVSLSHAYEIDPLVTSHRGDAWTRLAKRVTGDAENWEAIAGFNHAEDLTSDLDVHVPFLMLRPELQRQIIKVLFPDDRLTAAGWKHVVIGGSGIEGESLWQIAEWFTGDGANYVAIRKANAAQTLSTRKGDVILIPKELLTAAFGGEVEGKDAPKTAEVRKSEDDPVERPAADAHASETAVDAVSLPVGQPSLTYVRSGSEPYAVYRLQKGEALYSSVAIRFTGRVYARDVGDVLDRIVKFNGIEDVARIPAGKAVKIPMSLLLPEYLPADDPARLASESQRRESAKLAKRVEARGLGGVQVIIDAGHGGRDVGTTHDGVYESDYVYDVACRLKHILEKKSAAKVHMTTRSKDDGWEVMEQDVLDPRSDHEVLTTPHYELADPVVGVHLRWYLANSIFHRAIRSGVPREKVIFISLHADSLHPSLRGLMAYIPGERYSTGSFQKSDSVYLARAEVRESPVVRHSEKEALAAEGLSRDLAESIIDTFEQDGLQVHPFHPIRDNVVRGGREWVPAVIRYNLVPTRLLLEICNLANPRDRALMETKKYRQQVAQAVYEGISGFFAESDGEQPGAVTTRSAAK